MEEWRRQNQFNSFNSWKGLLYAPWYEAVLKGKFLPPIEASIDPIHQCNLQCVHCNAGRYIRGNTLGSKLGQKRLLELVDFLGDWGVKAVCYGGGGEPTLHPDLATAIVMTRAKGMEVGIATNGTLMAQDALMDALKLCRWIGVSVDAATPETYQSLKGINLFKRVLANIRAMVDEAGPGCDVAFKFLISTLNQHEILEACKIAKALGVRDFHARPADVTHQGVAGDDSGALGRLDVDLVMAQFQQCHELENDQFRVFTVVHKFDEELRPRKAFSQCYAAPLAIQLCADGWAYFCVDQRHREEYRLGRFIPNVKDILKFWGGEKHKELVFAETPRLCHTRCTFGVYCEQAERLFAKKDDPMCKWFT